MDPPSNRVEKRLEKLERRMEMLESTLPQRIPRAISLNTDGYHSPADVTPRTNGKEPLPQGQYVFTQFEPNPKRRKLHDTEDTNTNTIPRTTFDVVKTEVEYPPGYDATRRRFSISSESINPEKFHGKEELKQIPKPESVKKHLHSMLKENVLFSSLTPEQLEDIVLLMWEENMAVGVTVITEGDAGDNMYIIDEGELSVSNRNKDIATIGPGSIFGEISLMYCCPRTATIRAITHCKLWALDRSSFRRILMEESIKRRALYISFLEKVPIFDSLIPYERAKVADALEPVTVEDKHVIIRQGSTDCDRFYIIERGSVICSKKAMSYEDTSEDVECSRLSMGDYFGELALLTNQPRGATVVADGSAKLLTISRKHFDQVMGPCEAILKRNTAIYASYESLLRGGKQERLGSAPSVDMEN